jgi:hypothetical protein
MSGLPTFISLAILYIKSYSNTLLILRFAYFCHHVASQNCLNIKKFSNPSNPSNAWLAYVYLASNFISYILAGLWLQLLWCQHETKHCQMRQRSFQFSSTCLDSDVRPLQSPADGEIPLTTVFAAAGPRTTAITGCSAFSVGLSPVIEQPSIC